MLRKLEKIFPLLAVTVSMIGLFVLVRQYQEYASPDFFPAALADDEGSEGEGSEDESSERDEDDEEETVTTYIKLPDQVVKRQYTVTLYDSDGDGVFDQQDPTPNIHDAFIVKDDDRDGIDDQYGPK